MKIREMIAELEAIESHHGNIEVRLQSDPDDQEIIVSHEGFFIIPEEYSPKDGGWIVNLRSWPY